MPDYYGGGDHGFSLFCDLGTPRWRSPQRGVLGALLAHWSLPRQLPALASLPTGAGKTAVALAAPHLIKAQRVLVVVPSRDLRGQTETAFRSQDVLYRIGAITGATRPRVLALSGLVADWATLRDAEVVVALPNSISPSYYESGGPPPKDLFDLVIIDEAHHAPARTWRAILEHFEADHALLLTATPRRRDGQRLPGEHIYHYPLRQALDERLYQPVVPVVLDLPPTPDRDSVDELIAAETIRRAAQPEHATSTVLIRASTVSRANALAARYRTLGLDVAVLHNRVGARARAGVIEGLRDGRTRAVAVVDMLGEGFDLPRSLLIGRVSVGVVDLVDSEVRAAGCQRADCPV